ncbi:MAG TPA: hypothetical protein VJT84_00275 [Gaiellaceae bacterium]|nr:hypothetical protein [Gaiellaceae bacterium]
MATELRTVEVADDCREAWLEIERRGWGDGLPCVPPTPELVDEMLGDLDPDEVVAELPPLGAPASYRLLAVNAVMAGCDAASFPVVCAAVRAVCDPAFNLLSVQSTTNPATEVLVVNGPVRARAGFVSERSCLGNGARANLTTGRAVRLAMSNIGGARPGRGDLATHGFPGKIGFCFAEAEESSPWPPFHAGSLAATDSAVTVVAGSGTLNLLETTDDPEELLRSFAQVLAFPGSNDVIYGGTPLLVLSPEHARILAGAGLAKEDVQLSLYERATISAGELSPTNRENLAVPFRRAHYGEITASTRLHVSNGPEDILVVVAGGPGTHSVYVPTFGESRAVTRRVAE